MCVSPSRPRESTPETALLAPNAARRLLVYAVGTDAAEKMELLRSIGAQGSALRPRSVGQGWPVRYAWAASMAG
ncbi:hypothetical protein APR08_003381 [Nocardia amikacinitolerans]|nr:hypothetical protein [Nocardia amikacinitolerans]